MSDSFSREWSFYLDDMIDFAGKVLVYKRPCNDVGSMKIIFNGWENP